MAATGFTVPYNQTAITRLHYVLPVAAALGATGLFAEVVGEVVGEPPGVGVDVDDHGMLSKGEGLASGSSRRLAGGSSHCALAAGITVTKWATRLPT